MNKNQYYEFLSKVVINKENTNYKSFVDGENICIEGISTKEKIVFKII